MATLNDKRKAAIANIELDGYNASGNRYKYEIVYAVDSHNTIVYSINCITNEKEYY